MKDTTKKIYEELFERYPVLNNCKESILNAFKLIKSTYQNGGSLYCGGNGGSSSDCEHIVGELLKSFKKHRAVDEKTASSDACKIEHDLSDASFEAIKMHFEKAKSE